MSDQSNRERRKHHLVIHEGVTPKEAEDFLETMELAGRTDAEGYAQFLLALDERVDEAASKDAELAARKRVEEVVKASSGRLTQSRVRDIQRSLGGH
jgi:hypothetical protein